MSEALGRSELLIAQERWDLAERELRRAVAEAPDSASPHGYLAIVLNQLDRHDEALTEADLAIGLLPDAAVWHYVRADILRDLERWAEAEAAIEEAIRLDPEDANYHASHAAIHYSQSRWSEALRAAETGLTLDPENVQCLNLRGLALTKLGRRHESTANMEEVLALDPENAFSHAILGWNSLERSRPKEALEQFKTALRLDPELDYARQGMIEALKARHFIYRILLVYFLWMARLSSRAQWAVIIGLFVLMRVLKSAAKTNPSLEPLIVPILVLYGIFCVLTWVAQPMFNLLLRLNRFGRYALLADERTASNWFGGFLASAVVLVVASMLLSSKFLAWLGLWFMAMVPIVAMAMSGSQPKRRRRLCVVAAALGLVGLTGIGMIHLGMAAGGMAGLFVLGWFLFPLIANVMR